MNDITPQTFQNQKKPHPIVATLPPFLKDPANYEKVEKAILEAGATKHSHAEVVDWAGCMTCQGKQIDRLRMMRSLGFQSAAQYMAWKRVHQEIKERVPLAKYNKP